MTEPTTVPEPSEGGSYQRDPVTGALTRVQGPQQPAQPQEQPQPEA